jgi:hypothetical protein
MSAALCPITSPNRQSLVIQRLLLLLSAQPPCPLTSSNRQKASLSARHITSLAASRSRARLSSLMPAAARVVLALRGALPLLLPAAAAPGYPRSTASDSCTTGATVACMPVAPVMTGPGWMRAQQRHSSSSAQLSSSTQPAG